MSGKILWKLVLTCLLTTVAVLSLQPLEDTPFEDYIENRATAKQDEFKNILSQAKANVGEEEGQFGNLFLALEDLVEREEINVHDYFPDVRVAETKNLNKRNSILLTALREEALGKVKLGLDLRGGMSFTLEIDPTTIPEGGFSEEELQKVVEIMSERVNSMGLTEPIVRTRGTNAIEIQLPGVNDRETAESLARPAILEFRLVHRTATPLTAQSLSDIPPGYEVLEEEIEADDGEMQVIPHYVKIIPEANGSIIDRAGYRTDGFGSWEIIMNFTSEGSKIFEDITTSIAERNRQDGQTGQLAIVLDGKLYSAPNVSNPIISSSAQITGNFTQLEAQELSQVLNNPLEAKLELTSMAEVGPTLAEDARENSVTAAMIGAGLVVVIMIFLYRVAGIFAVAATALNLVLVIGTLAAMQATVTLPGVAALVLTIGMAVDANILIYERIREELQDGMGLIPAIESGFNKAFSTIIDANVTTLITAAILIQLGEGPVKGFGTTLAVGIVCTVFCALIFNRMLIEFVTDNKIIRSMLSSKRKAPSFVFDKAQKPAFLVSWVIVAIGIAVFVQRGDKVYGIDFLGGEEIAFEFSEPVSSAEIEALAEEKDLGEVQAVYQTMLGDEGSNILKVKTELDKGKAVIAAIEAEFADKDLKMVGETLIGASVSERITTNAIISVAIALLGILLYVALRFEIGYGIGAVVATVHDVLMTIGIFVLLGGQFTAPMVAAILMIVGYSLNDTIVVFDRIREELQLDEESSLRKIINLAINLTLTRTVLTSITTFAAASALFINGAGVVQDYALIFIIGICTGTFSSIFIASPVFFWWNKGQRSNVEKHENLPKYDWDVTPNSAEK